MGEQITLQLPECGFSIKPCDIVRLGRFDHEVWRVGYGWYAWGGNRPTCGWFLTGVTTQNVKPLQLTDLDDIYLIENTKMSE